MKWIHNLQKAPHFLFNVIALSLLLLCIDILKNKNPLLLGIFGFVSGSFFFVQLLQYSYIHNRAKTYTTTFLRHSIVGYGVAFLLSILFYVCIEHTSIYPFYAIIGFSVLNLLIWFLYVMYFKTTL